MDSPDKQGLRRLLEDPDPWTEILDEGKMEDAPLALSPELEGRLLRAMLDSPSGEVVRPAALGASRPTGWTDRRRRWARGAVLWAAAAACVLLAVRWRRDITPGYGLLVEPQHTVLGGPVETNGVTHLSTGGALTIELAPHRPAPDREVRAYLRRGDRLDRWQIAFVEPSPGFFRFRAERISKVDGLTPGPLEMVFVIGRRGDLPDDSKVGELINRGTANSSRWRLRWQQIVVEAEPGAEPVKTGSGSSG